MNVPRATLLGWQDDTIVITQQYVRFCFISDGSSTRAGWNIEMISSGYAGGEPLPVSNNVTLYVDANAPEKVATTGTVVVGRTAYTDAADNSVFVRVI